MKKLLYLAGMALLLAACSGSTNKTGGAARDSGASHGYSGADNPNSATGSGTGSSATSTGGSDMGARQTTDTTHADTVKK